MRQVLGTVAVVVILYLLVCAVMFAGQRALIYFPQPRSPASPLPAMALEREGEQVLVTVREAERTTALPGAAAEEATRKAALLYFGGNAEDAAAALPALSRLYPDRTLYALHYRGYGGSSGRPTEAGLVGDGLALFDAVAATHPRILVLGRSLGSGIATQVAAQRPVEQVVLVTPYNSLLGLAADLYPWLPVKWLLKDRYESWRAAPRITAPTRIVVAEQDHIVPRASSEALLAAFAPGVATFAVVTGTDHNSILGHPGLARALGR